MDKLFTTLLTLATLSVALPAALADCELTTSAPEVDTGATPAGQFYVDNDACQPTCIYSIWIYQESNGVAGLQRSDEVHDDTCGGVFEGDLNIF
ncbi:MAG TPA: hypothetical protein VM370_07870 [Candidatus Thermoplasmatota archaeon]|nr:hypothetical protein [Candidatus Thermoplasmatota archaeon]